LPKLCLAAIFLLLLRPAAVLAQAAVATPATAPQLSPKAAYAEAMHPLEVTRHSIDNWSDIEKAALAVTMDTANKDCAARDATVYRGGDLVDLARLCALGQSFPSAIAAAARYIASTGPRPELAAAYSILVDAQLRMKDEPAALASALQMLDAVPYDAPVAETVGEAIDFMQFVYTPDALQLATKRQPLLLARMNALATQLSEPPATPPAQTSPSAEPPQSLHELYVDGISLAVLQQFSKAPAAETATTVTALDAALPATLTPDDSLPIAITRRRYALLGKPLPNIFHPANVKQPVPMRALDDRRRLPQIPAINAITGLLLFPDWCAQCLRMAADLPPTVFMVAGHEAYLYGLLTLTQQPTPPAAPAAKPSTVSTPPDAAQRLRTTPTLIVDPSLLDQFAATDVPYLILTDTEGIVRILQPVGDDALKPGGPIDSAIALVGTQWPSPKLKPPPPSPIKPTP
jgi:hypothetical protein